MRKAAADTLAGLCTALMAPQAAPAAAEEAAQSVRQEHQQQGLAALEGIAPAMAAAVQRHLKHDRIPQVRQAAAALLQLLRHAPGMQPQEPRPPAQQLRHGGLAAGEGAAAALGPLTAGCEAAAVDVLAPPLDGPGRGRGDLKALIADRRRQLRESGERAAAAAVKAWRLGSAGGDFGKLGGGGSSTGSADDEPGIPAWCELRNMPAEPAAAAAEAAAEAGVLAAGLQDARVLGAGSRPPSAEAFAAAAAALARLAPPERQQQAQPAAPAARRRGWGSEPASPAKQGSPVKRSSADVPVQVFLARSPPPAAPAGLSAAPVAGDGQRGATAGACVPHGEPQASLHSVWRRNPLAQSAEGPDSTVEELGRAAAAAAPMKLSAGPALPCAHHVQTPQVGGGSRALCWPVMH